jgi:hypothetical protein
LAFSVTSDWVEYKEDASEYVPEVDLTGFGGVGGVSLAGTDGG